MLAVKNDDVDTAFARQVSSEVVNIVPFVLNKKDFQVSFQQSMGNKVLPMRE